MRTFALRNCAIEYTLEFVDRKTLGITVKPDLRVLVRAPLDTDEEALAMILTKRMAWILRQQRFFAQFLPRTPERQYVSGETHLYLGRQYRLRVREAPDGAVKLLGGYIYVFTRNPADRIEVRRLLDRWYVARARPLFRERLDRCMRTVAGKDLATPKIQVRRMMKRWGSCSLSGTLTLNLDLIRAPRACIDYVITHELCHLHHPNHSAEFYELLTSVMPDWQERKLCLEQMLS